MRPAAPSLTRRRATCTGGVPGLLERLHKEVSDRLREAYAPKSQGPLATALRSLANFADTCPDRELLLRPRFAGDPEAAAHNEWTLILWAWFMVTERQAGGKPIRPKSAASYVSLAKGYLSFRYAFDVVDRTTRLRRLLDDLVRCDPLGGVRKKRRGFRRRHLRRLGRTAVARSTHPDDVNRLAAVGASWHVLARGGEICPSVAHARWDCGVHPTRADLAFYTDNKGGRYAVLWLRPLKKKGAALQPKVPQYIAEHDGSGSDVYYLLRRLVDLDPVRPEDEKRTPLFRQRVKVRGHGMQARHMTVRQLRGAVRAFAAAIGYADTKDWGAHSGRIGGATDLASTGEASALLLRAKGRWASDIGAIYARLTRRAQLASSRLMQKARGRDLEEIFPEFTQPA